MRTSPVSAGQLYISHAPDGTAYARKLTAHLRTCGITATFDQHQPHELEMDVVRRRMERSAALLVVMTKESGTSAQVLEEIELAEQSGLPVLALLRSGSRTFRFKTYIYEDVTRGRMPTAEFVEDIRAALGAEPSEHAALDPSDEFGQPGPGGPGKQRAVVAGAAALVIAIVGAVFWFGAGPRGGKTDESVRPPPTSGSPSSGSPSSPGALPSSAAAPLPPAGVVTVTSHRDGDLVDRCEKFEGTANLDKGKTILFAKMRTTPPDTMWYFVYAGSYRNGFVAPAWQGTVYFGNEARQRYDLFVIVMDVAAAGTFWTAHQSKDGSYAYALAIPANAEKAAVVRVQQGTTDDCR